MQILILIMAEAGFVRGADIYDDRPVGRGLNDRRFSSRVIRRRGRIRREGESVTLKSQKDAHTKEFQMFLVFDLRHAFPPLRYDFYEIINISLIL